MPLLLSIEMKMSYSIKLSRRNWTFLACASFSISILCDIFIEACGFNFCMANWRVLCSMVKSFTSDPRLIARHIYGMVSFESDSTCVFCYHTTIVLYKNMYGPHMPFIQCGMLNQIYERKFDSNRFQTIRPIYNLVYTCVGYVGLVHFRVGYDEIENKWSPTGANVAVNFKMNQSKR